MTIYNYNGLNAQLVAETIINEVIMLNDDGTVSDEHTPLSKYYDNLNGLVEEYLIEAGVSRIAVEPVVATNPSSYDKTKKYIRERRGLPKEEFAFLYFCETVTFMIKSALYEKGALRFADDVGMSLIRGKGCVTDLQQIERIYIDAMLRVRYDRSRLMEMLKTHEDTLMEDEKLAYEELKNGRTARGWQIILMALLQEDRAKMEFACSMVLLDCGDILCVSISKAYHMLLKAV